MHARSAGLLFTGIVVAGCGFEPAFAGALRSITQTAESAERGGLLAAIYLISYLAFSLPALAAGAAAPGLGLRTVTDSYAAAVPLIRTVVHRSHQTVTRFRVRRCPNDLVIVVGAPLSDATDV